MTVVLKKIESFSREEIRSLLAENSTLLDQNLKLLGGELGLRGEARGGWAVGASQVEEGFLFDPAAVDPSELELAATVSYSFIRGLAVEGEARRSVWGRNALRGTKWSLALATSPAWRWTR